MAKSLTDHIFGVVEGDHVVGQSGLRAISWGDRRCDWAFFVAHTVGGCGLGGAIERTVLRHVFEDISFQKLNCEVISFNTPVIDMHLGFGFSLEGRRRHHVLRDGKVFDVVCAGMLCDEFEG